MKDSSFYSLLFPFVDNYFHSRDYSIYTTLSNSKKEKILNSSIIYVEYDSSKKTLYIINSQNKENYISINFVERQIYGSISFKFDSSTNINYLDSVEDYIYNSELIKKVLIYTDLCIFGEIIDENNYEIKIEELSRDQDKNISIQFSKLFSNSIEFISLFNISKNKVIETEEMFYWVFNASSILAKISNKKYNLDITVKNITIYDKDVFKIRALNTKNIYNINFDKCNINCQNEENIEFLKSLIA